MAMISCGVAPDSASTVDVALRTPCAEQCGRPACLHQSLTLFPNPFAVNGLPYSVIKPREKLSELTPYRSAANSFRNPNRSPEFDRGAMGFARAQPILRTVGAEVRPYRVNQDRLGDP